MNQPPSIILYALNLLYILLHCYCYLAHYVFILLFLLYVFSDLTPAL